jgi:cytochrome c-type biogenesis protein CcmH
MLKIFIFLFAANVWAIDQAATPFSNPQQETTYQKLIEELRCVVCQNQSLADSNASLAQDLRNEVRSMVQQGKSEQQVTNFLVERYGDFVLYRPPLKSTTYLLWLGPIALLLIAFATGFYFIRRQPKAVSTLSADEQSQLDKILNSKEKS